MAKPIINSISAFDSGQGATITFSLSGEKSYGNKIWIYDTATLSLVYEYPKQFVVKKEPVSLYCFIPANVLMNGSRYYCQIQCVDADGIPGSMSEKSVFYCLTTPDFTFANITDGMEINASYIDALVAYGQADGERLQSYRFSWYDANKILLGESELFYAAANDSISYRFKGLGTGKEYYVRARGWTAKELTCDTGMVLIKPVYTLKKDFSQIYLENKPYSATIKITSSIKLIGFNLNNSDYLYIGDAVDLRGDNPNYLNELIYDNGFTIDGGFTGWLKLWDATPNEDVLTFSNGEQQIVISCHRYDGQIRFKLVVSDGVFKYVRYTDPVAWSKTTKYTLFFRREDDENLYDFYIFTGSGSGTVTNDYTMYQTSDGDLMLRTGARLPYYRLAKTDLYTTENVRLDTATGQLYEIVNNNQRGV